MTPKMTLAQGAHMYLDFINKRGRAEATLKSYRGCLQQFIDHVGDIQLQNVKASHVEDWFYGPKGITSVHKVHQNRVLVTKQPVSEVTHNHYRSVLSIFHSWCVKRGYVKNDWLENVDPMKIPPKARQQMGVVSLLNLLDAAKSPRDRAWIATLINTAKRSVELKVLKVGQVNLDDGMIYGVTISKTGQVDDTPISEDLDRELRRWMVKYAEDIGRPLSEEDYLFPTIEGSNVMMGRDKQGNVIRAKGRWVPERHLQTTTQPVKDAMAKLGLITKQEGSHTIRRSVARIYFDAVAAEHGDVAALRETAALLDHKNMATTERYLGMTAEKARRDRRLKGKPFLSAMVATDNVVQLKSV